MAYSGSGIPIHGQRASPEGIDTTQKQTQLEAQLSNPMLPRSSGPGSLTVDPNQLETQSKQNNTLGTVAKGLATASMYLGMTLKGLGKTAGAITTGVTLGAVAIPAGLIGLAGAGLTYGVSRYLAGHSKADALTHAKVASAASGTAAAMTMSVLVLPIGLAAGLIKGVGIVLMKPAGKENVPESFKKFDESFSTHILPVLGRIGTSQPSTLNKITQTIAAKFDEHIEYKDTQKAKDREEQKKTGSLIDNMSNFSTYLAPGTHWIMRTPTTDLFLEKVSSGKIFQFQNYAEAKNEGSGISIALDIKKGSVSINGKPAVEHEKAVLDKAITLLNTIKHNSGDAPEFNSNQIKQIESAYLEFIETLNTQK